MSLCSRCDRLSIDSFQTHTERGEPPSSAGAAAAALAAHRLWNSGREWQLSRPDCAFCALLWAALAQAWAALAPGQTTAALVLAEAEVLLEPKSDVHRTAFPERELSNGLYLVSLHVVTAASTLTGPKPLRGDIRLFTDGHWPCDPGSRRDVIGRPPLSGLACEGTTSLLRRWIAACRERHPKCGETLSGDAIDETQPGRILPRRVLRVDEGRVRVVPSGQRRGPYVALSHCWGPPDKQPLRSLKSNIQAYGQDIPWDILPKTYQDAITIVRAVDIPYIWIDSLCIVQDDRDDWLRESALMGSVYERAEFTLAASHASNSFEGFLHARSPPAAVTLPNFLPSSAATVARARLRSSSAADTFPERGALNTRSWATQEWLLSRRVVFFAPGGLTWSCKALTQRETGERCFNVSRSLRWKTVVEAYSERRLSVPTDRLVALDGLRAALQAATRPPGTAYLSGLWADALPDQLLWQVARRLASPADAPNPLGLPSWTWARVPCGVRFLRVDGARSACDRIAVAEGGRELTIRARGKLLPATVAALDCSAGGGRVAADIHGSHAKETPALARLLPDGDGVMGWLVYDVQAAEEDDAGRDYMLAVMSTLGRRGGGAERRHGNSATATPKKKHQYWCLIYRRMEDGACRRVGVGKSYSHEWWLAAELQDVTLS